MRAFDYTISAAQKERLATLEKHFMLTADFGRPLASISDLKGRHVIENWCRLIEVFSCYLFSDSLCDEEPGILKPKAKKALGHLRRFIDCFQRVPDATIALTPLELRARRELGMDELMSYAKMMQEVRQRP